MKYNLDDSVLHSDFGGGFVIDRFMSASGLNEIYIVDFGDNCIKRVFGFELSPLNPSKVKEHNQDKKKGGTNDV